MLISFVDTMQEYWMINMTNFSAIFFLINLKNSVIQNKNILTQQQIWISKKTVILNSKQL